MRSLFVVAFLTLVGCGGGGGSAPVSPATPDSYCDGYTRITPSGTFEQSELCGWEDPVLSVSISGPATRFRPAIVRVQYSHFGEDDDWTYESSGVYVERRLDELYVHNPTQQSGIGTITINGTEEFQIALEPDPVCDYSALGIDCLGYEQHTSTGPLIYYGEDDEYVVEWELAFVIYDTDVDTLTETTYADTATWVARMNTYLENSGVHVRLKLAGVYRYGYRDLNSLNQAVQGLPVDIVHAWGSSYPNTCGVAYGGYNFPHGKPKYSISACSIDTMLHEIGHTVGLSHGPENGSNSREGLIFPQFGHGWLDLCGTHDDMMSYGFERYWFGNSKIECKYGGSRGSREYSDSAYAINRVRYDVALIHDAMRPEEDRAEARQLEPSLLILD